MSANFTPVFGGYRQPGAFKFWCQKVLPLVYDDSLSYYELLCKVVDYINNLIHDNSETIDNMEALLTAYNQLQDYVNTYFANLDLTGEVSNKIDEMADDGELLAIIQPALNTFEQYLVTQSTAQQTYNEQTRATVTASITGQEAYNTETRNIVTEGILAQDQYNRETRTQAGTAINQQNTYNQQTRDMVSAMVGHPFTASTSGQMTDTTKIYVYTGTTTSTLTNGHWYYYNGSVWADGGTYNSTAVEIDSSLRSPGEAADAGAVGERLGYFAPPLKWTNGYKINHTTGEAETVVSGNRAITDFINCTTTKDIIGFDYTYTQMGGGVCEVNIYKADGTYLGFIVAYPQGGYFAPGSSTGAALSTCPEFQKVRFDINLNTFDSEYTARTIPYYYTDIYTVRRIGTDKYLKDMGVPADAEAVGNEIAAIKTDINERIDFIGYQISLFEDASNIGSIKYSDGTDNTSSSYNDCKFSDMIAVKAGWTIAYSARNATGNCIIAFYSSNGTYDQSNSVEGTGAIKSDAYTVPADGFVRIACRADISTHTFILTATGKLQEIEGETDENTNDIQALTFKQNELYPTAKMLTGADFIIGTHSAPAESRRIRLANNLTSGSGSVYFILPASNTYGYEVEIMNGSTRVGPSVNAWSFVSGVFKIVYAGTRYPEYNIYMKKSDNSDWTASDISNVKIIVVDGGKSDSSAVLNIMSHNVGHYNYGTTGGYSGADYADKVTEWREMLAKMKPDIILVQEYNSPDGRFDSGNNVNAQTALYSPIFKGFYTNALGGTGVGTIVTKMNLQATWDITVTAGDTRKFACGLINIADVPVVLCSVHLIPGTDATAVANRESQRNQLITALSGFDRVIIAGDFNASGDEFYAPFADNGYTVCNHGYFGDIITQADGAIDNIILKGLLPYDASANAENAITSDHYPLVSMARII